MTTSSSAAPPPEPLGSDLIAGQPAEVSAAMSSWADHETTSNNLWDPWVLDCARDYLNHCMTLK